MPHMHKNLAILAVFIISPFSVPTLAFAAGVPFDNFTSQAISGSISSPIATPLLLAQSNRARRIDFGSGTSTATISSSVVRGDRAIYTLRGDRGQTMTVTMESTQQQGGALFDVISPNGEILTSGVNSFTQTLPQSGEYKIIVGGSRGNASFRMTVSIN